MTHYLRIFAVSSRPKLALAAALVVWLVPSLRAQSATSQPDDLKERVDAKIRQEQADSERRVMRGIERFADRTEEVSAALDLLQKNADELNGKMKKLLTSDDGKRLADDLTAFKAFMKYQEEPEVSSEQIANQKKNVDAILSGLRAEIKHHTPGYEPSDPARREVEDAGAWTRNRLSAVAKQQSWMESAIAKAPKNLDLTKRTTLEEAIKRAHADELEAHIRAITESRDEARREMDKLVRDTEKHLETERIIAETEKKARERESEIQQMKAEYEARLKAQEIEQKRQAAEAETRYKDLLAQLERERMLADAKRNAENTQAGIEKQKIEDAAEKAKRIQRCKDPEVQQLLAPFLTKGLWQPGERVGSQIDQKPISFSKLTAFGALQPTAKGIQQLLKVATKDVYCGGLDKVRPRWPYSPLINRLSAEQLEEVKKAQGYLIELGPVMVEQGMLAE